MGIPVEEALLKIFEEDINGVGVSTALLKKLGASMNYLINNAGDYLGKIEYCALTEQQFSALKNYDSSVEERLKKWVMFKGQSIADSDFALLSGISNLPNAFSTSGGAFLGQLTTGAMLAYQASQNKSHAHTLGFSGEHVSSSGWSSTGLKGFNVGGQGEIPVTVSTEGGASAQPNTIRCNVFIKINE